MAGPVDLVVANLRPADSRVQRKGGFAGSFGAAAIRTRDHALADASDALPTEFDDGGVTSRAERTRSSVIVAAA